MPSRLSHFPPATLVSLVHRFSLATSLCALALLPASIASASEVVVLAEPASRAALVLALELEMSALGHTLRWEEPSRSSSVDAQIRDAWMLCAVTGAHAAIIIERHPSPGAAELDPSPGVPEADEAPPRPASTWAGTGPEVWVVRIVVATDPPRSITADLRGLEIDRAGRAVALMAATMVDDALDPEPYVAGSRAPVSLLGAPRAPALEPDIDGAELDAPLVNARFVVGPAYSAHHGAIALTHRGTLALSVGGSAHLGLGIGAYYVLDQESVAVGSFEGGGIAALGDGWSLAVFASLGYALRVSVSDHGLVAGGGAELWFENPTGPDPTLRAMVDVVMGQQGEVLPFISLQIGIRSR